MNDDGEINDNWIEDLGGLSFEELRELPFAAQARMDTAVFD